jgi:hypothetical protein
MNPQKIHLPFSTYYRILFSTAFLLFFYVLIRRPIEAFINTFISILTLMISFSTNPAALQDSATPEEMRRGVSDALRATGQYAYLGEDATVISFIVSFVTVGLMLCLLSLMFVNSRKKILKDKAEIKEEAWGEFFGRVREILPFKNLRIFQNPGANADNLSFASVGHRYLILNGNALALGNSTSESDKRKFSFLLHHELNHLRHYDSVFQSLFLAATFWVKILLPLFWMKDFAYHFGGIFFPLIGLADFDGGQYLLSLLGIGLGIVKIGITYYFYSQYVREYRFFNEFDADRYAYLQGGAEMLATDFRAGSREHPDPESRASALKSGRYRIDLAPLFFLLVFVTLSVFDEGGSVWRVFFLALLLIIAVDKIGYRGFHIKKQTFIAMTVYLVCSTIQLIALLYVFPVLGETLFQVDRYLSSIRLAETLFKSWALHVIAVIGWLVLWQTSKAGKADESISPEAALDNWSEKLSRIFLLVNGILFVPFFVILVPVTVYNQLANLGSHDVFDFFIAVIFLAYFYFFAKTFLLIWTKRHPGMDTVIVFIICVFILQFALYAIGALGTFLLADKETPEELAQFFIDFINNNDAYNLGWHSFGEAIVLDIRSGFAAIKTNLPLQLLMILNLVGAVALIHQTLRKES